MGAERIYKEVKLKKRDSRRKFDTSELFEGVLAGDLASVERIVKTGFDINKTGRDRFSALMLAATTGNSRLTDCLIKNRANVNARNDIGQTALMIGAQKGHKSTVKQLIAGGADVNAVDKEGRNAIACATSIGDFPEVISTLAVCGTDYNRQDVHGLTPLMRAALMGFSESVGILRTLGADETVEFKGKTAYELAAQKNHRRVCEVMDAILENRPKGHRI